MVPYEQVSFVVVSTFVLTQQVLSCGQQGGMGMLIPTFGGNNNHGLMGIPVFTNHQEKPHTNHHHEHHHQRHGDKQRKKEKKSNSMVTYRKEDSDVSHLKLYDHSPENKPLLVHKEDNSEQTKDARRPLQSFGWGMNHGRKWPKPVKPKRTTTTVIPTTQSERQQQLQTQKSQKEEKKKKIGNVIDSLLGMSLMGALGGGEVAPPKKEAHHKKRDPEPAFPIGQMVASHSQYTVETDKGALTCVNAEKDVHSLFGSECTHSSCKNKEWDGSCVDVHILMTILINQCQFTPEKQCPKKGDSLSSIEDIICKNPEELVKTLVRLSNSDCTPSCKKKHSAKTNNPVV